MNDNKMIATVLCGFFAMAAIGLVAMSWADANKRTPVQMQVEPGIEYEITMPKGDEPMLIQCRKEDGK